MKTLYLKETLAWIAFICAIVFFTFTVSFAQEAKEGKSQIKILKEAVGKTEAINAPISDEPDKGGLATPNRTGSPPFPIHIPDRIPSPDTLPVLFPINPVIAEELPSKRMNDGIENGKDLNSIETYPNPSNGQFTVSFHSDVQGDLKVRVADITGKEIFTRQLGDFVGTYSSLIDLRDKGRGIYILTVEQDNKQVTKRIIIN